MHEEPYTQAMLDMALKEARGKKITEIHLAVGRFSAIVPASVEVFFRHLSLGTPAQGARLVFQTVPIALCCTSCGRVSTLDIGMDQPVHPALGEALSRGCRCGGKKLKITDGLGFEMIGLTVDPQENSK